MEEFSAEFGWIQELEPFEVGAMVSGEPSMTDEALEQAVNGVLSLGRAGSDHTLVSYHLGALIHGEYWIERHGAIWYTHYQIVDGQEQQILVSKGKLTGLASLTVVFERTKDARCEQQTDEVDTHASPVAIMAVRTEPYQHRDAAADYRFFDDSRRALLSLGLPSRATQLKLDSIALTHIDGLRGQVPQLLRESDQYGGKQLGKLLTAEDWFPSHAARGERLLTFEILDSEGAGLLVESEQSEHRRGAAVAVIAVPLNAPKTQVR